MSDSSKNPLFLWPHFVDVTGADNRELVRLFIIVLSFSAFICKNSS